MPSAHIVAETHNLLRWFNVSNAERIGAAQNAVLKTTTWIMSISTWSMSISVIFLHVLSMSLWETQRRSTGNIRQSGPSSVLPAQVSLFPTMIALTTNNLAWSFYIRRFFRIMWAWTTNRSNISWPEQHQLCCYVLLCWVVAIQWWNSSDKGRTSRILCIYHSRIWEIRRSL